MNTTASPSLGARAARWTRKHLLGLEDLSPDEILAILDTAESFAEISTRSRKKVPALQGRIVFNLFFENSTRTRTSFSLAAKRLSADTQDFSASVSSLSKGETFIDTAKNIEAMGADVMVVRHPTPGAPHLLAQQVGCSVVNAGDGAHEHPTQALLDLLTIRQSKGRIEGLTVGLGLLEERGLVEDQRDFLGGKVFQPEQVPPRPAGGHGAEVQRVGGHVAAPKVRARKVDCG